MHQNCLPGGRQSNDEFTKKLFCVALLSQKRNIHFRSIFKVQWPSFWRCSDEADDGKTISLKFSLVVVCLILMNVLHKTSGRASFRCV